MKNFKIKPQALILCGGLGTRFRGVSNTVPKSLAVVSGKPILKWLVDDLLSFDIKKIILCTGHLSEKIEFYCTNELQNDCIISKEKTPLGTGGAIKNAEKYLVSEQIIVLNGDSRIKFNFKLLLNYHIKKNADLSILVSSSINGPEYGSINLSDTHKVINFNEKQKDTTGNNSNAGVYCMNKKLLNELDSNKNYSLENDLLPLWIKNKEVFGYLVNEPFSDIGTKERFEKAKFE